MRFSAGGGVTVLMLPACTLCVSLCVHVHALHARLCVHLCSVRGPLCAPAPSAPASVCAYGLCLCACLPVCSVREPLCACTVCVCVCVRLQTLCVRACVRLCSVHTPPRAHACSVFAPVYPCAPYVCLCVRLCSLCAPVCASCFGLVSFCGSRSVTFRVTLLLRAPASSLAPLPEPVQRGTKFAQLRGSLGRLPAVSAAGDGAGTACSSLTPSGTAATPIA